MCTMQVEGLLILPLKCLLISSRGFFCSGQSMMRL